MNKKEIEQFKIRLEKEVKLLEGELSTIGESYTQNSNVWDATSKKMEVDSADDNEVADKMEELEDNEGIMQQLTKQLKDVKDALGKIERGDYGKCEVSGEQIEKDRLEANPSARTCKKHMK